MKRLLLSLFVAGFTVFVIAFVIILVRHPDVIIGAKGSPPELSCLQVPNGPKLQFKSGRIRRESQFVGTYQLEPGVPGKYGPRVAVKGIDVREEQGLIRVSRGQEEWFWPILPSGEVELYFYPQNRVLARRC